MEEAQEKQNIFLTTAVISSALLFMLITGYFIVDNTGNSNSREMAVDERMDNCYEEKGLN